MTAIEPTRKVRHRPFQFRLRTIFWLTAVVGVACVVGTFPVKQYREQARRERMRLQFLETLDKFDGPNAAPAPER